eukprot:6178328-Pleurochrysis_carterae.AAC.2
MDAEWADQVCVCSPAQFAPAAPSRRGVLLTVSLKLSQLCCRPFESTASSSARSRPPARLNILLMISHLLSSNKMTMH